VVLVGQTKTIYTNRTGVCRTARKSPNSNCWASCCVADSLQFASSTLVLGVSCTAHFARQRHHITVQQNCIERALKLCPFSQRASIASKATQTQTKIVAQQQFVVARTLGVWWPGFWHAVVKTLARKIAISCSFPLATRFAYIKKIDQIPALSLPRDIRQLTTSSESQQV